MLGIYEAAQGPVSNLHTLSQVMALMAPAVVGAPWQTLPAPTRVALVKPEAPRVAL